MTYIKTFSGKKFDYINPTVDMIDIEDIATSLSRTNRFVGHSSRPYSVAEHSIRCLAMATDLNYTFREQLLVLMHDFTEAYVGDCPTPLKKLLPEFRGIEEKVEHLLYEYVDIEPPTAEEYMKIKSIDLTMLAIEMKYLTSHDWTDFIYPMTHKQFLDDEDYVLDNNPEEDDLLIRGLLACFDHVFSYHKYEMSQESS